MSSSTTSLTATPPTASPDTLAAQNELPIESHPFSPFLPPNGRMLFLGSFPPTANRWCMHFYYPNFINDFWRIMGHLFFDDRQHFVVDGEKRFDEAAIRAFSAEHGLAFFDTARRVRRLKGNAADAFLEVVEPTDIASLLAPMPACKRIVTTGGLAGKVLCETLNVKQLPKIGTFVLCPSDTHSLGRDIEFWRMPSSSRAYPLALEKKAEYYRLLFD